MKLIRLLPAAAVLLFALSCNNSASKETISDLNNQESSPDQKAYYAADSISTPGNSNNSPVQSITQATTSEKIWEKKLIRKSNLRVEVDNIKEYKQRIRSLLDKTGGYTSNETQKEESGNLEIATTLRIPGEQFEQALADLTDKVKKVHSKEVNSVDVTSEWVDTRSRLETKKQVRFQYLDLLKKAGNMNEIMVVQNEINSIQEEIDSATGKLNYLSHSSQFSTIEVNYFQVIDPSQKEANEGGFLSKLKDGFLSGWKFTGQILIGLVTIWPLLFLIAGGIMLLKFIRRKEKAA